MGKAFSPYELEQIVLAQPLVFGSQAAIAVLPALTADKFIYGIGENLGGNDHRMIWRAIEQCVLVDRAEPFVGNILPYLGSGADLRAYLDSLIGLLANYYHINAFDFRGYRKRANEVHKAGRVYRMSDVAKKIAVLTLDQDNFAKALSKIPDVDEWCSSVIRAFAETGENNTEDGYKESAAVGEELIEDWEKQFSGEQTVLLPVGVPLLYGAGLFPIPSFAVLHGLSSGGKSTLLHNVINLGTALGIVKAGLKGCVAINSLEMTHKQVLARMAASLAGFDLTTFQKDPTKIKPEDFERLKVWLRFVSKLPIVTDPDTRISPMMMEYRSNILHLGPKGPIHQLSTDYLELFEMPATASEKQKEAILGEIAKSHFQISRELFCSVIAASQSTYDSSSKTWIAGLYGQRGSRAITHKADIVVEAVNYAALKRAGTKYNIAEGLDDIHFWLLLEKMRGGATDRRMAFTWTPEYTRLTDPVLEADYAFGSIPSPLFEHLTEVVTLLENHPTTQVIPLEDTPLAHLPEPVGQINWEDWNAEYQMDEDEF